MKIRTLVVVSLALLSGCSSVIERRLEPAEKVLNTDGKTTMLFHSSLYYPTELSLRFDGYLIGVEKSPKDDISSPHDVNVMAIPVAGLKEEEAREKIVDSKLLYISHIIENNKETFDDNEGLHSKIKNCTIYNAYNQIENPNVKQIALPCPGTTNLPISAKSAFKSSWIALDQLESAMKNRIEKGKYTDIVVITMGWNTAQEEAIRNFNSITSNLKISTDRQFNPLVIGVTWPSEWESDWFNPVYKLFSFPNKAADADELGLTWLGVLLHKTIPSIGSNLPITVIGHSFGSRASSVAACIGPAIHDGDNSIHLSNINNLINFQGAFLATRLFGEKDKGMHFPFTKNDGSVSVCKNVQNIILTSSVHDQAVSTAFWGEYAGGAQSYKTNCMKKNISINCVQADQHGNIRYEVKRDNSNITFVNADELIKENAYLSGGGAHSDIYRKEHGTLINNLIPRLGSERNITLRSTGTRP